MSDIQVHKLVKVSILKKIYNYNELKCSLKIAKLRLELITKLKYKNRDDEKLKLKEKIKYYINKNIWKRRSCNFFSDCRNYNFNFANNIFKK